LQSILTITSPPATSALTTVRAAKDELNLTVDTDDDYLNTLIDRASAVIQNWIGRPLGLQSAVESFRHPYRTAGIYPAWDACILPYTGPYMPRPLLTTLVPVIGIALITEDGGSPLTVGSDYEFEPDTGMIWRLAGNVRSVWSAGNVVVTYTAGYVLPQDAGSRSLPMDIEGATLLLVRSGYYGRGIDPSVTLEVTEGVGRTQYAKTNGTGLDDGLKIMLAPYRNMVG
jgi:hypothetical protein